MHHCGDGWFGYIDYRSIKLCQGGHGGLDWKDGEGRKFGLYIALRWVSRVGKYLLIVLCKSGAIYSLDRWALH